MRDVVDAVTKATGQPTAEELYQRLYEPLSMLFVHSGSLSLARHLDGRNRVGARRHPTSPWTSLAALRTADACVGLLAAAVACRSGSASAEFVAYASDHRERTLAPLAVIFARAAPTSMDWPRVPETVRQFLDFARYCRSGEARRRPIQRPRGPDPRRREAAHQDPPPVRKGPDARRLDRGPPQGARRAPAVADRCALARRYGSLAPRRAPHPLVPERKALTRPASLAARPPAGEAQGPERQR